MGKRKGRRLAAMMPAGRRVTLDLFAEPSGDSGGSSAQDELEVDIDPRHHDGSPNSPSSSSGKQPENPLLLLGQYSDDDLDEESSKMIDHATAGKSSGDDDEQVKGTVGTENEDMENNANMKLDAHKDKQHELWTGSVALDALQNLEDNDHREIDFTVTVDLCKEVVLMKETSVPGTSDVQFTGDVNSNWKVVLHDESNQHYYWNTVTGETSWVVPDVLAQGTELKGEQQTAPDTEGRNNDLAGEFQANSTLDAELDSSIALHISDHSKAANVIHETQEIYEPGAQMEGQNDEYKVESVEDKTQGPDASQTEVKDSSGAADALYHENSSLGDKFSSGKSSDTLLGNGTSRVADSEKFICNTMVHEEDDMGNDSFSSILKHSEHLLGRLRSMEGSKSHMQGHDWISKYIVEVEIRLSDIKSLLPFGSSLLPFWVHCERQLKELEVAIDTEAFQFFRPAQLREAETTHKSQESGGIKIEVDGNEKKVVCSAFDNSHLSTDVDISTIVKKDSKNAASNSNVLHAEHVSALDYPIGHSGSGENSGVRKAAQLAELTPMTVLHAGEDVDMDVDMEVEDATPASTTVSQDSLAANCCVPEEQPIQPNPPAEHESFLPQETFGVSPPPDEDWIPPLPPDNELVPPPPSDDPPESSYPPPPSTYSETIQPLAYTEQFNLSYSSSNFKYYGQTNTEFPANNVYGHAEGCEVAVPHLPHLPFYYEALPITYPGAAPVVVNPDEYVAYYDLQDGAVLPESVGSGTQSSGLQSDSVYEALNQIRSVELHTELGCASTSNSAEFGVSAVNGGTEKASMEVPFTPGTIQAPATTSEVENAPVSSTTTVAVAAISTATNAKSKVSRRKKQTVAVVSTLRSNKKVSSLVDKWKAAKEELHEDEEDETEDAYEILKKKQQREIEEWRAQQIASGGVKYNANFQPLGGDWRKRVKRKRAQSNSEAVQTPSEVPTDGNQQPDLNELSRDLPSGWQAYWDESSKKIYFGNAIKSETTWTKPRK